MTKKNLQLVFEEELDDGISGFQFNRPHLEQANFFEGVHHLVNVVAAGFAKPFSNSLIIHEETTKEITTVKEVYICDPNYHKIRLTFALNFSDHY